MPYQNNAVLQKVISQKLLLLASEKINFEGKKILDVGSGTGFVAQGLVQGGVLSSNILQIDLNENSLQFAKNFGKTLQADFNKPLLVDEKFDVIISSMALQWAVNLEETLERLKAKLNKSGSIFCAVPLSGSLGEVYKILGKDFLVFPSQVSMQKMEEKIYAENALLCLKGVHLLNLKTGKGVISKKQLLLLKEAETLWKIGFFCYQNAGKE